MAVTQVVASCHATDTQGGRTTAHEEPTVHKAAVARVPPPHRETQDVPKLPVVTSGFPARPSVT